MIAIPFIYFSLLAFFFWRQTRSVGIGVLLASLFAFSAFFSIVADGLDLYGNGVRASPEDITLAPTVLYCSLVTLLIQPFQKLEMRPPRRIVVEDERFFNFICYVYMALLAVTVLLMFRGVSTVLHGNLQAMKIESRTATGVAAQTRGGVAVLLNYVSDFSFFLLPFFFVSLCFLRRSFWFNAFLFAASLMRVIISLLSVDRMNTTFWVYMTTFSLVFFRRFLTVRQRRALVFFGGGVLLLIVVYMYAVTVARFHFRSAGSLGGFVAYAGQSFIYFCHFYHNYPPVYSLYRLLPLFYSPITSDGISLRWEMYTQTGINTGIFTSVLGMFYADLGLIGMISVVLGLNIVFNVQIRKMARNPMGFSDVILLYAMAVIPLWGNITYWYNVRPRMMTLIYCLLVVVVLRIRGRVLARRNFQGHI